MNNIPILEVKSLKASINDNEILKSLDLKIYKGEIHAIMGPNGSGKSTLSKVLAGHPAYDVSDGEILFKGKNIVELINTNLKKENIFVTMRYKIMCDELWKKHTMWQQGARNTCQNSLVSPLSFKVFSSTPFNQF